MREELTGVATQAETQAMRRAIALAARGLGTTSPNPVVGCVILDSAGAVAGEGYHTRAGEPHAEAHALRAAGERARGGTAVVTLEPCNHVGRTEPCRQALLDAGIRRVVVAVRDPYPPAAGGIDALRAAGVDVETGVCAEEAAHGNEAWLLATRLGRPFVTWKYAASLDGRVAAVDGTSKWITSAEARADVHRLRAEVDAILVGRGTVLADDPQLTVRLDGEVAGRQPLRVVLASTGRIPPGSRVLDDAAPTLVAVTSAAGPGRIAALRGRAEVLVAGDADAGGIDLKRLLAVLFDRGVRHLFIEGGPTVAGSFAGSGLIDRVVGYVAPVLLGGAVEYQPDYPALRGVVAPTIGAAPRLRLDEVSRIGPDLRLVARPVREES